MENFTSYSFILEQAAQLLYAASSPFGIKASVEQADNYNRVWARDSAVSSLAILSNGLEELYPAVKASLAALQGAASESGQIPSNIGLDENGVVNHISFGGPAGRTDASFWWIIAAVTLLKQQPDQAFEITVSAQCEAIFKLAKSWEFNGKGLMYVPMSSNWADEYVTHGYVLYDQLLRYWALALSGDFFKNAQWLGQSEAVKKSVKQHYLFELPLVGGNYTQAQQQELENFNLDTSFIASFSPGDRVERYDSWSIALLLLLNIPSKPNGKKLENALLRAFDYTDQNGIPAFWPLINEGDYLYKTLKLNHSYQFKNKAGHFHNGGIWPVVNGFLIAGLAAAGFGETASLLMANLCGKLTECHAKIPFTEYFDYFGGMPGGVKNLCFSASGVLLADAALQNSTKLGQTILPKEVQKAQLLQNIFPATESLIEVLDLSKTDVTVIGIAGESGCGKTTLSKALQVVLTEQGYQVLIMHQDDYFRLPPKQNHQAREQNFDHIGPQEVRLDLLDQHIKSIKNRLAKNISMPVMNWQTDREETTDVKVENVNVIIVDGTYVLQLNQPDYKIYINTNYQATRQNRVNRRREEVTDFIESVLEKESKIIKEQAQSSDITLDSELQIINNKQQVSIN